jgi:hypothetical protein
VTDNAGRACLTLERDRRHRIRFREYVSPLFDEVINVTSALTVPIVSEVHARWRLEELWAATGHTVEALQDIYREYRPTVARIIAINTRISSNIAIAAQQINSGWMTADHAISELVHACKNAPTMPPRQIPAQIGNAYYLQIIVRK